MITTPSPSGKPGERQIQRGGRLAPPARTAGSPDWQWILTGLKLSDPAPPGGRTYSGGLRDCPHPAMAQ